MKKLINDSADVVDEMIEGIVRSAGRLAVLAGQRVVVRSDVEAFYASGRA